MESTLASRAGPLSILDSILDTRGTLYEADVFSVLRSCNFVLRGFEFAQADGALDCTNEYAPTASYADRLWDLNQRAKRGNAAQRLLLFDAKMASSRYAGRQVFVTINSQRKNVAFYIGICAANPAFVELIPNFYQSCSTPDSPGGSDDEDESRVLTINYARLSNLPPSAYTLNPDDSPYRMPLALLPEAIAGVRDCIRYRRPYVNPWTQAEFAEWAPKTTALVDFLQPREDSQHDTSYQAVMQMYRVINKQATQIPMSLELVSLQPRLADFKLLLHATSGAPDAAMPRQVFVQHKLDVQYRAKSSALTKVPIGRGPETDRRWYFEPFERFDFIMYQFEFSDRPNPAPYTLLLFLPEREIPDEFYLSELREANFERPNFHRYRIHMDVDGRWVARVWQIVLETPEPRHPLPRPHRPMKARKPQEAIAKKVKVGLPSRNQTKASGRQLYRDSTVQHQREFYDAFMTQCAKRKSCFLLVLSHHHPIGDFALCPYQWNDQEQRQWMLWKTPPKTISDLPGVPDVVPICYYTRDLEINLDGPALTAAQFRRLNSCNNGRLLIWNLWGSDETTRLCPLVVIPSEDLGVTVAQRELFAHNLKVDHMEEYQQRTPTISKILHTGLIASDYIVGRQGPGIFDGDDYGSVWEFFSQFTRLPRLQHPAGFMRDPAAYRCSLREIHRRLLQEHRRHTLGMIVEPEL